MPALTAAAVFPPVTLREYALLADGERGALVGPRGDIAFLCAPRWHDDAVFSSLLGGRGVYAVTPLDDRFVWGGHYEPDTLIWRSRWVIGESIVESRDALAFPGETDRVVLLRRVEAVTGRARVRVLLECSARFGTQAMSAEQTSDGIWEGSTGDLGYRWSGVPAHARVEDGRITVDLDLAEGRCHDLVLEIRRGRPVDPPVDPDDAWRRTEQAWSVAVPDLSESAAPGESHHSYAVLCGLQSEAGGLVAAATTSLPERADHGRNYDYRYAWTRDQCYTGLAAAAVGGTPLLDRAVSFVADRVYDDGARLRPAYTVDGDRVPDQRELDLPGYPGALVRVGNHANEQFQLDAFGEALLVLAAAERLGRLDRSGTAAVESLVAAVTARWREPDAGIWELEDRRWAHSRLIVVGGLKAVAVHRSGETRDSWLSLADAILESVAADCLHRSGRWQRAPDDERVDAGLLLAGVRGAVPAGDARQTRTVAAVVSELTDDGYVYRFRHRPDVPLHRSEGAFVLSGFHMVLAQLSTGEVADALRWFERNRGALGPPGLFTEEFDVVQRQLRGNLPQAFVHALALECGHALADAGVESAGFRAADR